MTVESGSDFAYLTRSQFSVPYGEAHLRHVSALLDSHMSNIHPPLELIDIVSFTYGFPISQTYSNLVTGSRDCTPPKLTL